MNESPLEAVEAHLDQAKLGPSNVPLIAALELLLGIVKHQQIVIDYLRKHTYGA